MKFIFELKDIKDIVKKILEVTNKKIFFLNGELGTGKTTLVKEFVKQIGSNDKVTSPSYSIINQYHTNKNLIFHIDLYRIKSKKEILDIGIEEYLFSNNYCFIEWSEHLKNWSINQKVIIKISYYENSRKIIISL